jgi:ADP-ribose pyrophosphatase YjhB (NUDIX family)
MFNFCPACASKKITFNEGKVFSCPDCSFIYYHNIAAATGCLICVPEGDKHDRRSDRLVFLVRGKEPAIGKLDLPGGFVDIGEGVIEGLYRELKEEIGWVPPVPKGASLSGIFNLFASFSNIYDYKGIKYNTCDMYFTVHAPGLTPDDLHLEQDEVSAVRFLKPHEIDFSALAFESTRLAVKTYLNILD